MNRGLLMALLCLDVALLIGSGFLVWERIQKGREGPPPAGRTIEPALPAAPEPALEKPAPPAPEAEPGPQAAAPEPEPPAAVKSQGAPPQARPKKTKGPARSVRFQYRDPFAQETAVAGEFNAWKPAPMSKDENNRWTLALKVPPGTYAYNFIVDGRMIRDPAAKRSKQAGQKIPSSVLVVK